MPTEALRDLLGIVRVMFAQLTVEKGNPVKRQELTEIGKLLRSALADSKLPAGCLGHRNGWDRAQEAVQRLALLVAEDTPHGHWRWPRARECSKAGSRRRSRTATRPADIERSDSRVVQRDL
jgi:hypothetical protein